MPAAAVGREDINPLGYGILPTISLEFAMIHRPVGMNPFTIKALAQAPMGRIALRRAALFGLLILGLVPIMVWPDIALRLPPHALNLK